MGAWIEIQTYKMYLPKNLASSLPSWERGLKFCMDMAILTVLYVAPLVGAWIEISTAASFISLSLVAPLVGAWIEIMREIQRV